MKPYLLPTLIISTAVVTFLVGGSVIWLGLQKMDDQKRRHIQDIEALQARHSEALGALQKKQFLLERQAENRDVSIDLSQVMISNADTEKLTRSIYEGFNSGLFYTSVPNSEHWNRGSFAPFNLAYLLNSLSPDNENPSITTAALDNKTVDWKTSNPIKMTRLDTRKPASVSICPSFSMTSMTQNLTTVNDDAEEAPDVSARLYATDASATALISALLDGMALATNTGAHYQLSVAEKKKNAVYLESRLVFENMLVEGAGQSVATYWTHEILYIGTPAHALLLNVVLPQKDLLPDDLGGWVNTLLKNLRVVAR
ncbi:MAG: hypothetical protein AAF512_23285 [Pseudomonadota bacterium]